MGLSDVAYNIASNRPSRYRDDPTPDPDSFDDEDAGIDLESDPYANANLEDSGAVQIQTQSRSRRFAHYAFGRAWDAFHAVAEWTKGPDPPRQWSITPILPKVQGAPLQLLDAYLPSERRRFWALILLYAVWLLTFSLVLRRSAFTDEVPGYGSPVKIDCGRTYWSPKNGCGLNGNNCQPFSNSTLTFRCPGNCIRTWVLEPRAVGDQEVIYRPLVVGGASENEAEATGKGIYRADSFVCAAAIHAGVISNAEGGCGVLELTGEHTGYAASDRHGIASTGFNSSFPRSFRFLHDGVKATTSCRDLRWPLLFLTVTCTAILSIFTTSPSVFFFSTYVALFLHVSLVSDPPEGDYYSLLSNSLGQLLPSTFIMYAIYKSTVHRTLLSLQAQFEKTFLWLGACWIGALNNETFDQRIPIQRLTPHDIKQQPGAIPALLIIVFTILGIALGQAWAIRIEGRMRLYLKVYSLFVVGLLLMVAIPNMHLRIHHYILGLLLLPGTAMQNRPSLLYQGLLVGLFINGVARWGYASILSTSGDLLGDAELGSALPVVLAPQISQAMNITFTWAWPPPRPTYDGISVLVNDVERFRGHPGNEEIPEDGGIDGGAGSNASYFTWTRDPNDFNRPEYFRFAYMQGNRAQDYTKAGIWEADSSWTTMPKGTSRRI